MPPIEINLLFELRVILGNAPPCAPRMPFTASRVRVREFASVTPPSLALDRLRPRIAAISHLPSNSLPYVLPTMPGLSQPLVLSTRIP